MEMAGSADLFGWVTSSAQELEGGRALLRPPGPGCVPVASFLTDLIVSSYLLQRNFYEFYSLQLSATDISAQAPMKGAAKCDNHCELQNSVNQLGLERTLRFWDIPESKLTSVTSTIIFSAAGLPQRFGCFADVLVCQAPSS